jgi:hypothetical protein
VELLAFALGWELIVGNYFINTNWMMEALVICICIPSMPFSHFFTNIILCIFIINVAESDWYVFFQTNALKIETDIKQERANAKTHPEWHERFKEDRLTLRYSWGKLNKAHERKKLTPVTVRYQGAKFAVPDT